MKPSGSRQRPFCRGFHPDSSTERVATERPLVSASSHFMYLEGNASIDHVAMLKSPIAEHLSFAPRLHYGNGSLDLTRLTRDTPDVTFEQLFGQPLYFGR
jgi:hypothetical protein